MKKFLKLLIVFASLGILTCIGATGMMASTTRAYAQFDGIDTLTFKYDNVAASGTEGTDWWLVGDGSGVIIDPATKWYTKHNSIKEVVFDSSFAAYTSVTSTENWFKGFNNLKSITGLEYLKTSNVTNMAHMFNQCYKLTSLDLSFFDTSKVTDMNNMFKLCSSLTTLDLRSFNTSNVTNMESMFSDCSSLASLDLSSFNTASVTSLGDMFYNCSSLTILDLSFFDTSKVTNMFTMFDGCTDLVTIYVSDKFVTTKVSFSLFMFLNCTSLVGGNGTVFNPASDTDITYAKIDGGVDAPGYFTKAPLAYVQYSESGLDKILTFKYDTTTPTGTKGVDWWEVGTGTDATSKWGTKRASVNKVVFDPSFANYTDVITTQNWFNNFESLLTITDLAKFNTTNVTNMSSMFMNCSSLTSLDLSNFVTSKVTNMKEMFDLCTDLTTLNLSNFNTSNVTDMSNMFYSCKNLTTLDLSNFNTSNVTDMSYMFDYCESLLSLALDNFDTASVTSINSMFSHCKSLSSLDLSFFNTSNVDNINNLFAFCTSLSSLDLSNFNTSNVTNMSSMFMNCSSLTTLDLSNFDTSKVTNMISMFDGCASLTTIKISDKFVTTNVTSSSRMFYGCISLVGGKGTKYDSSKTDSTYARIDGGVGLGYFSDTLEPYSESSYYPFEKDSYYERSHRHNRDLNIEFGSAETENILVKSDVEYGESDIIPTEYIPVEEIVNNPTVIEPSVVEEVTNIPAPVTEPQFTSTIPLYIFMLGGVGVVLLLALVLLIRLKK